MIIIYLVLIPMLITIGIYQIFFGEIDFKRNILNAIGLDLKQDYYRKCKEKEFAKNCKKAMKSAINKYNAMGNNEQLFLYRLADILYYASHGDYIFDYDDEGNYISRPNISLYEDKHYIEFAFEVVKRREKDLIDGNDEIIMKGCNFNLKEDTKKYVDRLWERYQHPWPDNWMIKN